MTMNLINENADIKNFFEKKMCKDVCEYMCEFAKPHLFEVGDEIDVNFTWKDDYAEEYGNECNSYQICGIDRNKYCSEVYIYEITNGVSLIYEIDEDDSQPKRLFIEKDSCALRRAARPTTQHPHPGTPHIAHPTTHHSTRTLHISHPVRWQS